MCVNFIGHIKYFTSLNGILMGGIVLFEAKSFLAKLLFLMVKNSETWPFPTINIFLINNKPGKPYLNI